MKNTFDNFLFLKRNANFSLDEILELSNIEYYIYLDKVEEILIEMAKAKEKQQNLEGNSNFLNWNQ